MIEGSLVEKAYGKINLGLKILGRRSDGYHDILSLVQCLDLADVLHFEPASSDQLTCNIDRLSTGPDNLIVRALDAFRTRLEGPVQAFRIRLEKRIPMGAGLGGGSADAAAVLKLNRNSVKAALAKHTDMFERTRRGYYRVAPSYMGGNHKF